MFSFFFSVNVIEIRSVKIVRAADKKWKEYARKTK